MSVAVTDAISRKHMCIDRYDINAIHSELAVALDRSGRHAEALAVVEQALAELPADAEWVTVAALTHTQVVLKSATSA